MSAYNGGVYRVRPPRPVRPKRWIGSIPSVAPPPPNYGYLVQHAECGNDAFGTQVLNWTNTTQAGNVLLVWANSDTTVSTPTASGVTFTLVDGLVNGNGAYAWIARSVAGAGAVTITPTGSLNVNCGIMEIGGVEPLIANVWEDHAAAWGNGVYPSVSKVEAGSNFVVYLAYAHGGNPDFSTFAWGEGQTQLAKVSCHRTDPNIYCDASIGYKAQVPGGPVPATWTAPSGGGDRNTMMLVFQEKTPNIRQRNQNAAEAVGSQTLPWTKPTIIDNVFLAWANSNATVPTPTATGITFTLVDSAINGNGAYLWIARSVAGAGSVTFNPGVGQTITCGIMEISGVDNTISNIWDQHAQAYSSSARPTATATTAATDLILFLAYSHATGTDLSSIAWAQSQSPLIQVRSHAVASGNYCDAAVGILRNVPPGSISGSWTGGGVATDNNSLWVALKQTVVVAGGKPKVWTGSAFADKPAKVWNGSAWVEKPMKIWNGSSWVLA
jgi:hypothetical protein